jgi:hypothetical protein
MFLKKCFNFRDIKPILFFNLTFALVSLLSMISARPFQLGTNYRFLVSPNNNLNGVVVMVEL